ncbi:MAG: caspase family protein, partial [Chitinophagaceae bacterium]
SYDNTARVWSSEGALLAELKGHTSLVRSAQFSADGKKIITASFDKTARVWSSEGALLAELKGHTNSVNSAQFSADGKKIVTASYDNTARVWSSEGALLAELKGHTDDVRSAQFSADGKKIVTASDDTTARVWSSEGALLNQITLEQNFRFSDVDFSHNKALALNNSEMALVDLTTGKFLYKTIAIDSSDYLTYDAMGRYHGTPAARKLLYFTCGDEVIELDQVKDQLWVPNIAERIMKGDSINAKTLSELNICGLTPEVEDVSNKENEYRFKIRPRRGGLGETLLYVNGIEVKRYQPGQLQKKAEGYELLISKTDLGKYFIPGTENPVKVKAYTSDNAISSRGIIITSTDTTSANIISPNLYAVMVGVSDYKGDELDLKYAAKDATDISKAVAAASKKLLNSDGREHVFMYNLTTAADRYLLPEKNSIKKTLEEIGKKATANDILLIFFAGHGVMQGDGDKKQFYFLTADASNMSAGAAADVGISTTELTEWMKPAYIKAQKRIMIFDACNSGQAIRDFVQLGKPDQGYIAARNDDKGQQMKAIEKLNNQSGLIILAASASDQSAYEMGRYSQGLLTYSLLKVMKQQPEILENGKYLDVSNWLNAAKKMVSSLASETGARQEPQLNTNNNFNIGLIDEEVRNKIILASEKPLFARSNFQNSDTKIDNLKLRSAIDKELISISSRGNEGFITYSADYEGADTYALTGDYKIAGNNISVAVLLTKGGVEVLHRFEAIGNTNDINELVLSITTIVTEWLKNHK